MTNKVTPQTETRPVTPRYGSIAQAMQSAQAKIENLARYGQALQEMDAACILPDGVYVYVDVIYISIHIPFDRPTICAVRRALGSRLKRLSCHSASDGDVCWNCSWSMNDGNTVPVTVWLMAEIKGATCKRVKVGEKVESVFQVVCQ